MAKKAKRGAVVVVAGVKVRTTAAWTLRATIENAKAAWTAMFAAFRRTGRMTDTSPERVEFRRLVADIVGLVAGAVRADAVYAWIGEVA